MPTESSSHGPGPGALPNKPGFSDSFVSGELHLGFWGFVKKLVGVLDSFFVLRTLSAYQYGVYQLFLSFYATVSDFFHDAFAVIIQNDLYRLSGEGRESDAKKLFFEYAIFRFFLAGVPSFAVWYFADRVALDYGYGASAVNWLKALACLFLVDTGMILASVLLKMRLQFALLASRPTLQKLLQFLFLAYLYWVGRLNLDSIFWIIVVAPLATLVCLSPSIFRALRPWLFIKMFPSSVLYPIIRGYGRWEIPQLFVRDLTAKVRPWVIKTFVNTESVGYYGIASNAVGLLRDLIPAKTLSALIPRFVHDRRYAEYLYFRGTKIYLMVALVVSLCGAVGYPVVVYSLFPLYVPSIFLFYVILMTIPVFAFSKLLSELLVAEHRQRALFYYSLLGNSVTIGSMLLLAPTLSILGIGLADTVGQFSVAVFKYSYLTKTGFIKRTSLSSFLKIDQEDKRLVARGIDLIREKIFRS